MSKSSRTWATPGPRLECPRFVATGGKSRQRGVTSAVQSGFCEQSDMSLVSRIAKAFRGASHIADASDNNRGRGEARAFGSVQLYREASGNSRVILWLDSLRADFVLAWRRLRKSKVTSAAAILSLALGIGACLAAFQLVDALLLRPLPIACSGSPLRSLSPGIPEQRPAHYARQLGISAIPGDARRRSESGHPDRHLLCRTRGNHLALR